MRTCVHNYVSIVWAFSVVKMFMLGESNFCCEWVGFNCTSKCKNSRTYIIHVRAGLALRFPRWNTYSSPVRNNTHDSRTLATFCLVYEDGAGDGPLHWPNTDSNSG